MQIQNKSFYDAKLKASTVYKIKSSSPRGMIFDHQGKVLVSNESKNVVSYTRSPKTTAADLKALAQNLSHYVNYTDNKVTLRAKKDYYLADSKTYAQVVEKLPKAKKVDQFGNSLQESTIYKNAVASLTEKDVAYSQEEEKVIFIFNQMNAAATFNTVNLRTADLTDQEIAYLVANKAKLPGITITTDWDLSLIHI